MSDAATVDELRELRETVRELTREVRATRQAVHDLHAQIEATRRPLDADDAAAARALLPLLPTPELLLASGIASIVARAPGSAGQHAREALAPPADCDGGARGLARLLQRLRGRLVGGRYILEQRLPGSALAWYAVRDLGREVIDP